MINSHAFHIALFFYDKAPQNAHALFIIYRLTFALWFTLFWSFSMPFSPFPGFPASSFYQKENWKAAKEEKGNDQYKRTFIEFFSLQMPHHHDWSLLETKQGGGAQAEKESTIEKERKH